MEITSKTKIKFESGKEIELDEKELQELINHYQKIEYIYLNYPQYPQPSWSPLDQTWYGVTTKTDKFDFDSCTGMNTDNVTLT